MNDPRITAYALGELTGREREKFERDLAASEDLQRELTATIDLTDALGKLPVSGDSLTDNQRDKIFQELADETPVRKNRPERRIPVTRILVELAAVLLILAFLASLSLPAITGALQRTDSVTLARLRAQRDLDLAASDQPVGSMPELPVSESLRYTEETPAAAAEVAAPSAVTVSAPEAAAGNVKADQLALADADSGQARLAEPVASETAGNRELLAKGTTFASGNLNPPQSQGEARGSAARSGEFRDAEKRTRVGMGVRRADGFNTEAYDTIAENVFLTARENPLSTFSIDVDTASYANVRRFLQNDRLPPAGAIRTEELLNYFSYDDPQPEGNSPFSVTLEVSRAPWDSSRELVRIGLKGREIPASDRGPANLVFLIDVSGSMDQPDKLPLLKRSLAALVENLSPKDRVAIVVYAGSSGLVLPSTPGTEKSRILEALERLRARGSTNGGEGIRLAYQTAREYFLPEGNNRVILCTDGDFNVGTTSQSELVRLIEKERASGVFLSVLGFGSGNLKDSTMEKLADKGNGNYAYIDSITEGRKVLVEQMNATLFTIAKDVKIQVEFNPVRVAGYRLIGYENRLLAKEDFNDDKKDAGEIGAGHSVTALYEIIPAGQPLPNRPSVDPLKYQAAENPSSEILNPKSAELLTLKLRYKAPDGDTSKLLEVPLAAPEIPAFEQASSDFQFAAAVAAFGMKLRGSPAAGDIGWDDLKKIVRRNLGDDPGSYRAEFLTLLEKASRLPGRSGARQD
jgi:Ca-activated chloride channel family protein